MGDVGMAKTSRCAAPAWLSAALLLMVACLSGLHAQTNGPTPDTLKLEKLSGAYAGGEEPDVPVSFYVRNGKLVFESENSVPIELTTISDVEYGYPGTKSIARFTTDDTGQGVSLAFSTVANTVYTRIGPAVHHTFHDYQRIEAMIPMRDGVKLHLVILKPSDITAPLPFLMQRTPYGCDSTNRSSFFSQRPELARDGYIYVCADIRGRFESKGDFIMSRPMADHHDPKAVDESTDAYDTIAWLLKNLPGNNGRVGVVGTSYPGFLAMAAGIDPHPAVKAISPQAPMIDVWMGDDFFHNGAFRQSYGYDYVYGMEQSKGRTNASYGKGEGAVDGFDYFLKRGSFEQDVKQSGTKVLPSWKLFLAHPAYDSVWSSRAVEQWLNAVAVPTLSVGGYYDQEDMFGPQVEYAKLEPHDSEHKNFLVLGPWRHGYWSASTRNLGDLQFGEPIGKEFRSRIEAKFFAHFLKDEPGSNASQFDLVDTASFQTGSNTWKYYSHFPPRQSQVRPLYIEGGGVADWEKPTGEASTAYTSDPADPVPYRHRPIQPTYSQGSEWYTWLAEDQRFVTARKDLAVWKLPVLTNDLTLTGEVIADIFAATTGSDNDLVVKLIDQYPDDDPEVKMRGYQLMTNAEIFRGRYLDSFEKPAALRPGDVREYKFSLHDVDHVFKTGHTVLVEIQSTWFPLYDRNPQTFVPNIMRAKPPDFKAATITVYSGPGHESRLMVPVMIGCKNPDCN
jgi:putative CocE/NonD family hydrolase